jgi:hypothetical protein
MDHDVAWISIDDGRQTAHLERDGVDARVVVRFDSAAKPRTCWRYDVELFDGRQNQSRAGGCPTEEEAKRTAIKAARILLGSAAPAAY